MHSVLWASDCSLERAHTQDYVSENEKLVEKNLSLQQDMNALQTRYRTTEASLKVILLDSLKYRHLTQKKLKTLIF